MGEIVLILFKIFEIYFLLFEEKYDFKVVFFFLYMEYNIYVYKFMMLFNFFNLCLLLFIVVVKLLLKILWLLCFLISF